MNEGLETSRGQDVELRHCLPRMTMDFVESGIISDFVYPDNKDEYRKTFLPIIPLLKQYLPKNEGRSEIDKSEIQQGYRETLTLLMGSGFLDGELLAIIGRGIRPSGLKENTNQREASFKRRENVRWLQIKGGLRGELGIGGELVATTSERLEAIMDKVGIHRGKEEARKLAVEMAIGHEYGHAIAWVGGSIIQELQPEFNLSQELAKKMPVKELELMQKLNDGLPREGDDQWQMAQGSEERFAMGVERLVLELALKSKGIERTEIDGVLKILRNEDEIQLAEYGQVLRIAKDKGISLDTLSYRFALMKLALEENQPEEKDIAGLLENTLNGQQFGYLYPLDRNQLSVWIKMIDKDYHQINSENQDFFKAKTQGIL